MKKIIHLALAALFITGGCAGYAGYAGKSGETTPPADKTIQRPWPQALYDTWSGTCQVRRFLRDSLTDTMTGRFTLQLDQNTFEYRDSASVVGRGTYAIDGPYMIFSYLLMERIARSPFNLDGRFEFIYRDSILILMQHEAVGPPVRNQVFEDKELTFKRVRK